MKNKIKLYFNNPINKKEIQFILDDEFTSQEEVKFIKIDKDERGQQFVLISVSDTIPISILKMIGNNRHKVISAVKEELFLIKKDFLIQERLIKKGILLKVLNKEI